jgi:hypothetical protein
MHDWGFMKLTAPFVQLRLKRLGILYLGSRAGRTRRPDNHDLERLGARIQTFHPETRAQGRLNQALMTEAKELRDTL